MKTKVLFLLLGFVTITSFAQRSIRIGYIDMEYILQNVEEYNEANELLEKRVQKWKVEIETQKGAIEQMKKDLSAEKVLLTKELIEERQEDIKALEETMIEYQQDRFGPQGDLVMQKRMLIQPIQDQVFNAVQDIAKNKRYDFVFDKSADVVMLYSEKRHDISDLVLRMIGKTRRISSKGDNVDSVDELEDDNEVNPELEERQKIQEERKAERLKAIEETREAKLKELEERKKAYEERRKKLLEERAAAKKAKEEKKENKEDNKEEEQKLN